MLIVPMIEYFNDSLVTQNMTHLRSIDGLPICGVRPPDEGRCGEETQDVDIRELECGRCKRKLIAILRY